MQYPKSNINPGPLHQHKLIIMAVAITLTLIAYVFFRAMDKLETAELERLENTLTTVLKTTHEALNFWQLEQINSVRHWASHRSLINHVEALAEISHLGDGVSDLTTLESLRMLVNTGLKEHKFDGFFVISPDFINLASMRDENLGLRNLLSGHEQRYLQRVFTGETLITQPVYSDVPLLVAGKLQHGQLSMFALSPVTNDHGDIIAAFAFRITPSLDFSRIATLGSLGKTGETFVFDSKWRLISQSRFESKLKKIGMIKGDMSSDLNIVVRSPDMQINNKLRSILSAPGKPLVLMDAGQISGKADKRLNGYRNYLGNQTVGVWLWDARNGFGLATEMQTSEAFQALKASQRIMSFLLGLSVLFLLLLIFFIERSRNQVMTLANQIAANLKKSERRFHRIYQTTPVSIWVEDLSELKKALDDLRLKGVEDFRDYFEKHPDFVAQASRMIKVLDVNEHTLQIFDADSKDDLLGSLEKTLLPESYAVFREELVAIAEGESYFEHEAVHQTLQGKKIHTLIRISIPQSDNQFESLLVCLVDITARKMIEKELTNNEQKYRQLVEDTNVLSWEADIETVQFDYISPQAEKLTGFTAEEWCQPGFWLEHICTEDREATFQYCLTCTKNRQDHEFEYRMVKQDGELLWIHDVVRIVYDDQGKPVKLRGVMVDITELKQTESSLRKNEEQLRRYFEAGMMGMSIISSDKKWLQMNDTYCEIVGYSREELQTMNWVDITHPEDVQTSLDHHQRLLSQEINAYTLDKRFIRKDGQVTYATLSVGSVLDAAGKIDYVVAFLQDITARKQMEQALAQSEQNFSRVFYNMLDAVVIYRLSDNAIKSFNPAFVKLTGYDTDEITGKTIDELDVWVIPEERDAYLKLLETEGEIKAFEARSRRKNGEFFPVLLSTSRIEIGGEECLVSWAHDLRDTKKAEEERLRLEQQLFRSQKMEAVGQLTGGIAHDFNNILASMLGYTNLAFDRCVPDKNSKLAEYLLEIRHGGERARDMIAQMLAYSRSVPSEFERISLQPLVEQSLKLLRPTIPTNIEILSNFSENLPAVNVDPTQIEQTIVNICINARDAIKSNGQIMFSSYTSRFSARECDSCHEHVSGDYVVLQIKDSGSGISNDKKSRIFEPFFTTKEVGKGTGMGLSMAHGIMHDCDGHIFVDSVTEQGTTISLLFPLVNHRPATYQLVDAPETVPGMAKLHGTIMVVDDDDMVARYLAELLEMHGFDVTVFTSSESARSAFCKAPEKIDLLLTDQTMPGLTGLELVQQLLALRPDLPVIISTGYSETLDEEVATRTGVSAFFKKPIDNIILLEKINELLLNSANHKKEPIPPAV